MRILKVLFASLLLTTACTSIDDDELTRDEAREMAGKSDHSGIDFCLELGWYGDDICDDFCEFPDPDCAGNSFCADDSTCDSNETCNAADICISDCAPGDVCTALCLGFCVEDDESQVCGGFANLPCDSDEWCSFGTGPLPPGGADLSGTCQERPQFCPAVVTPVCGRDGITYNNSCEANSAGVDAISDGPC